MVAITRRVISLLHKRSGRIIPIDVKTVIGRSRQFYRYRSDDPRPDRLRPETVERLERHNYVILDSDTKISRVHGLVDPTQPAIFDLNTTNGTWLNGQRVPSEESGLGYEVHDGDSLHVGVQDFAVTVKQVALHDHLALVNAGRTGLVVSDHAHAASASRLIQHLITRKSFDMRGAVGWEQAEIGLAGLARRANADGITLVGFRGTLEGDALVLADGRASFAELLGKIAALPGRKVVVLEAEGDPESCERIFARESFEDMLLLVSPGELLFPEHDATATPRTSRFDLVRASVEGRSPALRGAFDDAVDGIEALVRADSNVLDVDWVPSYAGRLRLSFGGRARTDERELDHSICHGTSFFRMLR